MNKEDIFNLKPDTMLFGVCYPTRLRVYGSNYYVEGIRAPTEKGIQYCDIKLLDGEILHDVDIDTDIKEDKRNTLLARGVMEYRKDRNGNYINQDEESIDFRDACAQIKDLTTQVKQLKMDNDRLRSEKKEYDSLNNTSLQIGKMTTNARGNYGEANRYEIARRMQQQSIQQPDEYTTEQEQQQQERADEQQQQSREDE